MTDTSPTFSVLLAAHNGEASIAATLDSVIAQSRSDWEVIVVDDGSADSTAAIAATYASKDPRIKVISKPNGGTSSARNVAARASSAPLLALLDQDDSYLPEYFEGMGHFIDGHPDYEIYSCNAFYSRDDGRFVPRNPVESEECSFTLEDLLGGCHIHPQALFRRSIFDAVGGFDEDSRCWTEDYDFWLRALVAGARHIYNPQVLAIYRWSSAQKSSDAAACIKSDIYVLQKLARCGSLKGRSRRIARRRIRECKVALANPVRAELEQDLASGNLASARSLYLRSRRAWSSQAKYLLALPVMMVSPWLFAHLFEAGRSAQ